MKDQKTFLIWYEVNLKGNWKRNRYFSSCFFEASNRLEHFKQIAIKFPEHYRNVSCDFEELLEEPEDNTYNDGYDKDDFEGYDSYQDC